MQLEVIKIIKPFLEFLKPFDAWQVHNMIAMITIMLDPCFKVLHVVENFMGCGDVIELTFKYDIKVVIPLLMVCFDWLNPMLQH